MTLKELQKTGETSLATAYSWKVEEAKVFWFQGEQETAMHLLKQLNHTFKVSARVVKQLIHPLCKMFSYVIWSFF